MRYVLDCSVAVRWFVSQTYWKQALSVLEGVQAGSTDLAAPDVVVAELGHVLRKLIVGKKLSADRGLAAVDRFLALPISLSPAKDLSHHALQLALDHSGTFYDALYLALAEQEDLQVLTADGRMARAFAKLGRTLHLEDLKM